jgi:hypothetical protein
MPGQPVRQLAHPREAHEEHQRAADGRERREVETRRVVRGHGGHAPAHAAVGYRDAGGRGHGAERGDARDDLDRNPGCAKRERLLPAPPGK